MSHPPLKNPPDGNPERLRGTVETNHVALFNCSLSLWVSYRQAVIKSGRQPCLALTPDGSVSNSREIIARFASLDEAKSVLLGAGWVIDGDRVLIVYEVLP